MARATSITELVAMLHVSCLHGDRAVYENLCGRIKPFGVPAVRTPVAKRLQHVRCSPYLAAPSPMMENGAQNAG
jgi:hypothetical protein